MNESLKHLEVKIPHPTECIIAEALEPESLIEYLPPYQADIPSQAIDEVVTPIVKLLRRAYIAQSQRFRIGGMEKIDELRELETVSTGIGMALDKIAPLDVSRYEAWPHDIERELGQVDEGERHWLLEEYDQPLDWKYWMTKQARFMAKVVSIDKSIESLEADIL